VGKYADRLPAEQRRLLADAIDHDGEVRIGYIDSAGQRTVRVIEQLVLDGDAVVAWCRLRDDERQFLLERITEVSPA
jgi:predicted DNA-binding transcriptional regulator YafY